jgi:hypothetical protein
MTERSRCLTPISQPVSPGDQCARSAGAWLQSIIFSSLALFALEAAFANRVAQTAAPLATHSLRTGLRNSAGKYSLSATQLGALLESLRHKTGFQDMTFDETGFLTLGDRARVAGGSAAARDLLMAAVDGDQIFELEAHNDSPDFAFARLVEEVRYTNHPREERIESYLIQFDLADFRQLRGSRRALAAFDLGLVALHELAHGVLKLHDAISNQTQLGPCDQYINLIRRELGLPERRHYVARVRLSTTMYRGQIEMAELSFFLVRPEAGRTRARRFDLQWEAKRVADAADATPCHLWRSCPRRAGDAQKP